MRDLILDVWPEGGCETVLDLGCRDCWHTTGLPGVVRHVGVDIWPEALGRGVVKARNGGIPGFEPVNRDANQYLQAAPDGSFEAVLAIDLLEHLAEPDALRLIINMGRVASKIAIVWTTLGMIEQGPHDVDGNYNPHEAHLWGPKPSFFDRPGWQVVSHPFWHGVRGGGIFAWRSL